jgi:hypothetical protein
MWNAFGVEGSDGTTDLHRLVVRDRPEPVVKEAMRVLAKRETVPDVVVSRVGELMDVGGVDDARTQGALCDHGTQGALCDHGTQTLEPRVRFATMEPRVRFATLGFDVERLRRTGIGWHVCTGGERLAGSGRFWWCWLVDTFAVLRCGHHPPGPPLRNSDFFALIDYLIFRRRGHRAVFLRRITLIVCGVIWTIYLPYRP